MQVTGPIDNLAVRVMRFLGAEWWPPDQTLEHNSTQTPPVTAVIITLSAEDFWCNIIRGTNSRVRELATRFPPCIDLLTIADGQLDLIEDDGLAIVTVRTVFAARKELLVV